MKTKLTLIIAALIFCAQASAAGEADAGKGLYAPCVACHGSQGEGNPALNSPALGGQDPAYIERQLRHFKSGVRGAEPRDTYGMQMRGMAGTLADDAAIANVSAYIATLPVATTEPVEHDKRNGEVQYNAACGACHGAKAEGNPVLNAPRLAGLDAVYLKRQYQNFGNGVRGAHPDDRLGKQMALMATMLATDKDLDDVIGFILAQ